METIEDNRNRNILSNNNKCDWSTKFCGCCCDMRTSVIAVNMMTIGMAIMAIGLEIIAFQVIGSSYFDDIDVEGISDDIVKDQTEEDISNIQDAASILLPVLIVANVVFIIVSSFGVYGAYKNKIWPVAVSLGGFILNIGMSIFAFSLIGIILASLFAYPHIFFIQELKQKKNSTSSSNGNVTENIDMAEIDDVTVKECDEMAEIGVNDNYDNTKKISVDATIV